MGANDDRSDATLPGIAMAILRMQAEELAHHASDQDLAARSPAEIQQLVHELRVHQIELEIQNEELRRTQYELEISRARYFDLYDMAPISYLTLNAHGIIQEANLTAATALQVPRSDLIGKPLSQFVSTEDQDSYYFHHRRLTATGATQVCELRLHRADHRLFWGRLETSAAPDVADGSNIMYRTVISDVTARVHAEAALHALNATLEQQVAERTHALSQSEAQLRHTNADLVRSVHLKDEFLAMMSHELRTPLNTILLITDAILENLYGPLTERQSKVVALVTQSGRHLLAMISDILDLTRISAGHEDIDQQPLAVRSLCTQALDLIQPVAQAKGIEVHHSIAPGISALRGDERRLTQILVNLLSNALKFTAEGGEVGLDVTADPAQEQIQFCVWDTGIGIADADMSRIFEPFTQLDSSLAREYAGVGLGLTLVQRLVDLHGGSISLTSTIGQGSRFTVSLPWPASEHLAQAHAAAKAVGQLPTTAAQRRVLIADDHAPTMDLYADLFGMRGHLVSTAHSGDEAIAQAREIRPDVAVLDIQMPGMDGLAAIRQFRGDPELASIPIIALTALAMPGDRERCLAAGATAYLAKPVSLRTLLTTIEDLLH